MQRRKSPNPVRSRQHRDAAVSRGKACPALRPGKVKGPGRTDPVQFPPRHHPVDELQDSEHRDHSSWEGDLATKQI